MSFVETAPVTEPRHPDEARLPARRGDDYDLLCLSHGRWEAVYRRPQHLLTHCSRRRRVFFVEGAVPTDGPPRLDLDDRTRGLAVATPYLPRGLGDAEQQMLLRMLLSDLVRARHLQRFVLWHDSPLTQPCSRHLSPLITIYDCADDSWKPYGHAVAALEERERQLVAASALVFVGGQSVYGTPRGVDTGAYLFPSSVDLEHFARARRPAREPLDQLDIPRPRLGVLGPVDHRTDHGLLADLADLRPDFHLVVLAHPLRLGVPPAPRRPNIHYLGPKSYTELPDTMAGWDLGLLPYDRREALRCVNPTPALECLAAGRPVVSTPMGDIINPYGIQGLVTIADSAEEFVVAIDCELRRLDRGRWLRRVDAHLRDTSWERTWLGMEALISAAVQARTHE